MKIIKINFSTYYLMLLYFFSGLLLHGIAIFSIVFLHEMGHYFAAKSKRKKVISVTIYPFGGITKIDNNLNSDIYEDLFIAVSGILVQLLLFFVIFLAFKLELIRNSTAEIFVMYNKYILLFNLIPIIPLDGSKIVDCLFNLSFSFKKSYMLVFVFSIISLIIFIFCSYKYSLNNLMMLSFILYKTFQWLKNRKYIFNKFLVERYLFEMDFKRNKKYCSNDLGVLRKAVKGFFFKNNKWVEEKEILAEKFDK